jgi:hypothetical protein
MRSCAAHTVTRGNVTLVFVNNVAPDFRCPRQYLQRVVLLNAAVESPSQSDNVLEWTQAGYFIHAVINPTFYAWNSGHWLVEDFMDADASYATFLGIPQVIGLFVSLPYSEDDAQFNLAIHATLDATVAFQGSLPEAPSDYWWVAP